MSKNSTVNFTNEQLVQRGNVEKAAIELIKVLGGEDSYSSDLVEKVITSAAVVMTYEGKSAHYPKETVDSEGNAHISAYPFVRTEYMTPFMISVTPEMAKEIMDNNKFDNRKIKTGTLNAYISDMEKGKWKDGDTIAFDEEGNVIDGQHRLLAVIKSKTTQKFYFRRNVDPTKAVFDMGALRSIRDIIKIMMPEMDELYLRSNAITFLNGLIAKEKYKKVTLADVLEYIDLHHETLCPFMEKILSQKTGKKGIGAMPTMTALYLAYVNGVDLNDIDYFYRVFKAGYPADITTDVPIIATRHWFEKDLFGGGAEVRSQIIDRVQYGLRQYLQRSNSNRYRPPKDRIWCYPDEMVQEGTPTVMEAQIDITLTEKAA